jgi:hypothetical protein
VSSKKLARGIVLPSYLIVLGEDSTSIIVLVQELRVIFLIRESVAYPAMSHDCRHPAGIAGWDEGL